MNASASVFAPGAARAKPETLPCPSDNISVSEAEAVVSASSEPPTKSTGNASYWARVALEIEMNATEFVHKIGRKYRQADIRRFGPDSYYFTLTDEQAGLCHVLEFTITLDPATVPGGVENSGEYFNARWKNFNDRFFRPDSRFGEWLRVLETQKSGMIHAHMLVESCNRIDHENLQWRKTKQGKTIVDGRSCPQWLTMTWAELRGEKEGNAIGLLREFGFGFMHTLQPIKTGGKVVGSYFAKYIRKGIGKPRAEHFKCLRMREYSRAFPRAAKAIDSVYGDDGLPVRVRYWSEKYEEYKERILRRFTFEPMTHSAKRRRKDIGAVEQTIREGGQAEFDFVDDVKAMLGPRWAWYMNPIISLAECCESEFLGLPWEMAAKARAISRYSSLVPWYKMIRKNEEGQELEPRIWSQSEFDFCNDFEVKKPENWEFLGFYKTGVGNLIQWPDVWQETWFAREFFWGKMRERMLEEGGDDGFNAADSVPVMVPKKRELVQFQAEFESLERKGCYHVA